ncbi:UPF0158 family protein [Cryobacterium roopkundense]|uniref:Uncharacterized protein n=1 Tax=Cryobacterium roopkundense TaxID=1001240 RepID=A0A7W8ZVK5_9MICO|nr:UPF0158 family protein [Cryobacterium roopkundense]MBB5640715.1 hypothetical protein [Cryobacterium roopkundense]
MAEIDLETVTIAMSNGEGGYYDEVNNEVFIVIDGDVITGEDDEVDLDEVDWIGIEPDDSRVKFLDMLDFANSVTDDLLSDRLLRALEGRGVFRRFRDTVFEQDPDIGRVWHSFQDARTETRAIEWLVENDICDATEATQAIQARAAIEARALQAAALWPQVT